MPRGRGRPKAPSVRSAILRPPSSSYSGPWPCGCVRAGRWSFAMQKDEDEIRELVSTWMSASKAGDVDTVLSLMTDDAVFLVTGQPVMSKADFARAARAQATKDAPSIEGHSNIREINVLGDWAYMWSELRVVITPAGGAEPMTRAGHTLTILRKHDGKWLLARDANMLVAVPGR